MADEDYGVLFPTLGLTREGRIRRLNKAIENIVERGASNPRAKARLAKLMALRDALIAKEAAAQGAAAATGSGYPGVAGGLGASGIRGIDVIEHQFTPEMVRQYNEEGAAQGARATTQAPPGSGRLNYIPFVTAAAPTVPVQVHTAGGAPSIGALTALQTNQINWAILKIVAFTAQSAPSAVGAFGIVEDLRVGGSANLFLNETASTMDEFDVDRDTYTGLRAYPYLVSPNQAFVTAGAFGGAAQTVTAALQLVVDVIRDDAFGPGLPGVYAR